MKTREVSSLKHKLAISVPASIAEYDALAKRTDAALDDATDYEIFHGTLGDVREEFCALIEEKTGVKRREIGTGEFRGEGKDKKEITKDEKPDDFYRRVCAEKGLNPDSEPFADLAKRLSAGGDKEVKFDPSVQHRTAGPKKLPAEYATVAAKIIDAGNWEKNRKLLLVPQAKGGFYGQDIGAQPKERDAAIATLGWAIRTYSLAEEKARRDERWK